MALKKTMDEINKKYGDGSIMSLGSGNFDVATLSSGILPLDLALGGGWPLGRIMEIFGAESSGKTTLGLYKIAAAQAAGLDCAFVDLENALDPVYAAMVGVDIDKLLISQPSSAEHALDIIDDLVKSGDISLIVLDSVAALTPRAELEGAMGDAHMGLVARLMSQALRKINNTQTKGETECTVLFLNQVREKIGVVFGNPEVTTGGRALKFYSSVRIETRSPPSLAIKDGDEKIGQTIKATVVKNKIAPPFRVAEFDLMYGVGIDREQGIFQVGLKQGKIAQKGAFFYDAASGEKLGQGKNAVIQAFKNDPALAEEFSAKLFED